MRKGTHAGASASLLVQHFRSRKAAAGEELPRNTALIVPQTCSSGSVMFLAPDTALISKASSARDNLLTYKMDLGQARKMQEVERDGAGRQTSFCRWDETLPPLED